LKKLHGFFLLNFTFEISKEIDEVDFRHDLTELSCFQFCLSFDAIQSQVQLPPFVLDEVVAADGGADGEVRLFEADPNAAVLKIFD
jgi:hypothetical protein